jgi:hypothetical protein
MNTSASLLDELKAGGYEASIITTFNAYLPFYEDVVLRKLVSSGVRHNVLLMDQAQCQLSFASHPPRLAGRRYTLVPVRSNGAFHPKVILLLGKKKGLLAVGSHNMTLSGFGLNRELTNLVTYRGDSQDGSAALIQQAWQFVQAWLQEQGGHLPEHLHRMAEAVGSFAPWLKSQYVHRDDMAVIASTADGPTLLAQLSDQLPQDITKVIVGGAFFDHRLEFLDQLCAAFPAADVVVAIDPKTVKAPAILATHSKVKVIDASRLAAPKDGCGGYLHAKYLLAETENGQAFLVTGSANPSAPAWLATGLSINTEIMLLRGDDLARDVSQTLGLVDLVSAPPLNEQDWESVKANWADQDPVTDPGATLGIAVAEDGKIRFQTRMLLAASCSCELLDGEGNTLGSLSLGGSLKEFTIEPDPEYSPIVAMVRVCDGSGVIFQFFVHHVAQINEQSRTGAQRKFSEALSSLSFASPDLETFLNCVDRIIFSSDDRAKPMQPAQLGSKDETNNSISSEAPGQSGFAVNIDDTKKEKKKRRFHIKEDLAYLLDVLIYHLKTDDLSTATFDSTDQLGRTEEEQVGSDDSDEVLREQQLTTEEENKKILQLCHRKVKTLINRVNQGLAQLGGGAGDLDDLVVKLIAVLAVLRELRNCDSTQSWIKKGETTVPVQLRKRLLAAISTHLFEGDYSLLHIHWTAPDIADTDDVVKLKGLIIWLAWDCGMTFIPNAPFAESSDEQDERMTGNASLLAISQTIRSNESVIKQARESIGPLCGGDFSWLDSINAFGHSLNSIINASAETLSNTPNPGDIAMLAGRPELGFRLVRRTGYEGDYIALVCFAENSSEMIFQSSKVSTFSANHLLGANSNA